MLRILDLERKVSLGETVGGERSLAWPINVYRVTLPKSGGDGKELNPFDGVVFRLLTAVGPMKLQDIADETCLPFDLVKYIVLRLQDRGLIDRNHHVVANEDQAKGFQLRQASEFSTGLVFRELATGRILPVFRWLDESKPLKSKDVGERRLREIRGCHLYQGQPPTKREVIAAIRSTKRRAAVAGGELRIPSSQNISIVSQPDAYWLDCAIGIQKHDGEFRIADPFGDGYSRLLTEAFQDLLEQDEMLAEWLVEWKKRLTEIKPEQSKERVRYPFETKANIKNYPKLVASLRPAAGSSYLSIPQIYAAIEWAIFYVCRRRDTVWPMSVLRISSQDKHPSLIAEAAQAVGFLASPEDFRLVKYGRILDFERQEKAEMATVLAICLLQATQDQAHPLWQVSLKYPDLMLRLQALKRRRDENAHGKRSDNVKNEGAASEVFMRDIVNMLIPEVLFLEMDGNEAVSEDVYDARLHARASLQSEFGIMRFNRLPVVAQGCLVQAEIFWVSCADEDDAVGFAFDLYASIQAIFMARLAEMLPPSVADEDLVNFAEAKAASAGFSVPLPASLRSVKLSAIRQTLLGTGQTLGACIVAFLLMADDDVLSSIHQAYPRFIEDSVSVICRRGHGNEPLKMEKREVSELRKAAYRIITALSEV